MRRLTTAALLSFGLGVTAACGGTGTQAAPTSTPSQPEATPTPETSTPTKTSTPEKTKKKAKEDDSGRRGRQTVVVTRIIDGDTFEARGLGEGPVPHRVIDVRMLEIDTVEEGQCGYEASTDKLASLLGDKVRVERDRDLKDQYGRWLLYVWSGGVFVNLEMVQEGWAKAVLYEPNDKYWDRISAADTSDTYTPWPPCGKPEPPPQQPPPEEDDDDDRAYLFPPPPPDKDCGGVSASNFQVRPGDPHRFDSDGDGIGCES